MFDVSLVFRFCLVFFVILPHTLSFLSVQGMGVQDDSHDHVSFSDSNQKKDTLILLISL